MLWVLKIYHKLEQVWQQPWQETRKKVVKTHTINWKQQHAKKNVEDGYGDSLQRWKVTKIVGNASTDVDIH
jgi:hypothetical protein